MTSIIVLFVVTAAYLVGVLLGHNMGYKEGLHDGKRDMSDFINNNTRTKEIK